MNKIKRNDKHKILKLYYHGVTPSTLTEEYHVPSSTFFDWAKKIPRGVINQANDDHAIKNWYRLNSHCKKLENELNFLKRTVIRKITLRERMKIVDKEYGKESLNVQCDALEINRSTYLNHKNRGKKDDAWFIKREAEYSKIIKEIYEKSGHVYGAKKIAAIMRKQGKIISNQYARRIMSELGLHSNWNSGMKDRLLVARHLREASHSSQDFQPDDINQVWVSDTSAVLVHGIYYYICVFIDLLSRKIVGFHIGRNNSTNLVKRTFLEAYSRRSPKSLIVHTDNGSCYTSYSFELALKRRHVSHSYSRPHVPHDNAVAESFFNTLKREGIFLNGYPRSRRELEKVVGDYIVRYNTERPHEHLNYMSPDEFEQTLHQTT